jgi:hypothetical protein
MYCSECGTDNPEETQFCKQCGQPLPTDNYQDPEPLRKNTRLQPPTLSQAPQPSWWHRLSPDWQGALAVTLFLVLLGFLSDLIPGLGFVFSLPFTILVYYTQGVLVGRYARANPAYKDRKYFPLGVKSGIWTSLVIGSIFTLLALAIQNAVTLGTAVTLIPLIVAQTLFEIFMNATFSGIGAWLSGWLGSIKMIWVSLGIVGCGIFISLGLAILLVVLMGLMGIQIFRDLLQSLRSFRDTPHFLAYFSSLWS